MSWENQSTTLGLEAYMYSTSSSSPGIELCPVADNSSSNFTQSTLYMVHDTYKKPHAYVTFVICIYGVITNVLNIVVLTKPNMRNSINCILTGIAVADTITMLSLIPFAYYYYLMDNDFKLSSLAWTTYLAVHMNLTLTSHTSSIWLGVIMAAMRYFFIRPTARGAQTLDCRSTIVVIVVTYLGAALLIIPNCLVSQIEPCFNNQTGVLNWHLKQPSFGQKDSDTLQTIFFFMYPVAGKIIPCTLISIFGGLLLHTLKETDKRARRLKGEKSATNGNNQTRRTTIMLLAIIALYIIAELPQSILILLCIFVEGFFRDVYALLADFIDLLSMINCATNFITYIAMSTQFRKTLGETCCACVPRTSCVPCKDKNAIQNTKYSKTPPEPV